MQSGSIAHESSGPIYDAARLCSTRFEHRLEKTDGASDCLVIEELWGEFNLWAAYVGVFAVPKASLDARLALYGDVKDIVLDLLYMIQDNLIWGTFIPYLATGMR